MFAEYWGQAAHLDEVKSLQSPHQLTWFGLGAARAAGVAAKRVGGSQALLLIDPGLARSAAADVIRHALGAEDIGYREDRHVTPTPTIANVHDAADAIQAGDCDVIVALGGGSTLDVAKLASPASAGTNLADVPSGAALLRGPPVVAIPSTAGTGAEASSYAFVVPEHGGHLAIHDATMRPAAAVIDPLIHVSMPPALTAATGMNALADAIEAYLSVAHTPESDAAAMQAIHDIGGNLETACRDGQNLEARDAVAAGAYQAARAFDEAGLGIVDSISLALSAIYNIGHSEANALILPHVMTYDAIDAGARLGDIARAITGDDASATAEAATRAVQDLAARCGLSTDLRDHGITRDDLYLVADAILQHPFTHRNPRPLDAAGLQAIFTAAVGE